jgi:neutral trehalase
MTTSQGKKGTSLKSVIDRKSSTQCQKRMTNVTMMIFVWTRDFPNAWAPLQHMIIEGLATLNSEKANKLAQDISRRWLKSNYLAFEKTGRMVEKYDVRSSGKIGGGGEYETQTGFGWTNGVALALLHDYGWAENQPITSTYNLIPWFPT